MLTDDVSVSCREKVAPRMAIDQAELQRLGLSLSVNEFERLVRDALRGLADQTITLGPQSEFTREEFEALQRGSEGLELDVEPAVDPVARTAAMYAAIVASSLTVSDTARMLNVDPSRIRQRLLNRTLYGIKVRGEWRLPVFQFDTHQPLPGLERVIPRLDPGLYPVGVVSWFALPDPDLESGDEALSPRDWLRVGGDPTIVAEIASEL
jgi:hypothetical protein